MRPGPPVRISDRVTIRSVRPQDYGEYLASVDDGVVGRQGWVVDASGPVLHSHGSFRRWARRRFTRLPLSLVVEDVALDAVAGFYELRVVRGTLEGHLGWWFGPTGRGRGLAAESLSLVLDYARRDLNLWCVHMGTACDNARAIRQIETTAAELVSIRPHELPNGETAESRWYRIQLG